MRKEATLEQWRDLYEIATRIVNLKLWEKFWDSELIAVQDGKAEDTVFFSVLGHNRDCYGIVAYEGYEAFNNYKMFSVQDSLNLSVQYVMGHNKNLTLYLGNREELSTEQRRIIKDLGYKYRGKNGWMFFTSYEPGYYPFNFDQDEVVRMTKHLRHLEIAMNYYEKEDRPDELDAGKMYLLKKEKNESNWGFYETEQPFFMYRIPVLKLNDPDLMKKLKKQKKNRMELEVDVEPSFVPVDDQEFKKPGNPSMSMIGDTDSAMMIKCELVDVDDEIECTMDQIIELILEYGKPRIIRVQNGILELNLRQFCKDVGIPLERVECLYLLENFKENMRDYMWER